MARKKLDSFNINNNPKRIINNVNTNYNDNIFNTNSLKSSKNNYDNKNKSKESLTFNAISRVFLLALFTLIMVLGFTNGTLDFIQDHKTTYAVENYIESDFKTFDDINGKTIKFNNKINFEYANIDYIRLVLDVNKIPNYNYKLFTITNNDNFTIDYIINKDSFNYTSSAFIYFSELSFNYNGSFVIRYPYPNLLYLYSFVDNQWIYDNENQTPLSITFSDDFTYYITSVDIPYYSNLFIQFLNYNTKTLLSNYSDDFYYYDWRFKLNQLSNFRPLFDASALLDEYNGKEYTKQNYQSTLQNYYSNGYVTHNGSINPDYINWFPTDLGIDVIGDKELRNFIRSVAYWRSPLSPVYASSCFTIDDGVVTPNIWYQGWNENNNAETINSKFNDYLDGIIGFLYSPINLTYNVYVFFDFILRW